MKGNLKASGRSAYLFPAFITLIPFISSASLIDTTLISRQIAITLFALASTLYIAFNKGISFPQNAKPLIIAFTLFISGYAIGIFHAHNQVEALYWLSKITLYSTCFYVLYILLYNDKLNLILLRRALALFCIFSIALIGYEAYTLSQSGVQLLQDKNIYEIHGPFGHKNLFSSILFLSIPFLLQMIIKDTRLWKKTGFIVLILMIGTIFFLQTKAVLLGIFIACIVCLFPLRKIIPPQI